MHFLQVAAIAICLAAVLLSPVQCNCQLGCNCGIPGCNCGGGEQCPSSEGGPSEQGNPNEGISISFTESPSGYYGPTMNQGSPYVGSTTGPAEYNVYCTGDTNCCTVSKEPTGNYMYWQFPSKVDYTTAMNWMKTSGYTNGGCKASSSPYSLYIGYSSPYVQNTPVNIGSSNPQSSLVPETEAVKPSEQGLETPNGETIKPGDKITLSPEDKVTLGVNCLQFIGLVKSSMGTSNNKELALTNVAHGIATNLLANAPPSFNYYSLRSNEDQAIDALHDAVAEVSKCVYVCGKLFSGGYDQPLTVQSAPKAPLLLGSLKKTSSSPAQIGLHLESGPLLSEVVNNGVSLDVDTATATVSSVGNNTFGVVYEPKNSFSYIVAYQRPVKIQPKNNSLAPFTLNGSQAVIVDAKNVSQIVPLSSIPTNTPSDVNGSGGTPSNQSSIEPTDNLQKLEQLKKMLDAGLITQEDYNSTKNQILSRI